MQLPLSKEYRFLQTNAAEQVWTPVDTVKTMTNKSMNDHVWRRLENATMVSSAIGFCSILCSKAQLVGKSGFADGRHANCFFGTWDSDTHVILDLFSMCSGGLLQGKTEMVCLHYWFVYWYVQYSCIIHVYVSTTLFLLQSLHLLADTAVGGLKITENQTRASVEVDPTLQEKACFINFGSLKSWKSSNVTYVTDGFPLGPHGRGKSRPSRWGCVVWY